MYNAGIWDKGKEKCHAGTGKTAARTALRQRRRSLFRAGWRAGQAERLTCPAHRFRARFLCQPGTSAALPPPAHPPASETTARRLFTLRPGPIARPALDNLLSIYQRFQRRHRAALLFQFPAFHRRIRAAPTASTSKPRSDPRRVAHFSRHLPAGAILYLAKPDNARRGVGRPLRGHLRLAFRPQSGPGAQLRQPDDQPLSGWNRRHRPPARPLPERERFALDAPRTAHPLHPRRFLHGAGTHALHRQHAPDHRAVRQPARQPRTCLGHRLRHPAPAQHSNSQDTARRRDYSHSDTATGDCSTLSTPLIYMGISYREGIIEGSYFAPLVMTPL